MAVHPSTLGNERAQQDRALELEQLVLNQTVENVQKTFTDYCGYANVYFVSRATPCVCAGPRDPVDVLHWIFVFEGLVVLS